MTRIIQVPKGLNDSAAKPALGDNGWLETADEVVIRKPGVVSCRPGIMGWNAVDSVPLHIAAWDGTHVIRSYDAYVIRCYSTTDAANITFADPWGSTAQPSAPSRESTARQDALAGRETVHGDLLLNTSQGILRLNKGTRTALYMAQCGAHGGLVYPTWAGSGSLVPNNSSAMYAAVLVRTVNGIERRSAPFGVVRFTNTSGAASDVTVYIYFPWSAAAGDKVEVYRSEITTGAPDAELGLIYSTVLTSAVVSSRFFSITDSTADASRGAAAYFSTSQGGLTEQNLRPPSALCMEQFNGSMFYGDTIGPYQKIVSIKTPSALAQASTTTTTTSGLPTCTVASAAGLEKGMALYFATNFPIGTYITAISGTNLTMSANATATGADATTVYQHTIRIGSSWSFINYAVGSLEISTNNQTYAGGFYSSVYEAQILNDSSAVGGGTKIVFSEIHRERSTQDAIRATAGSYYDPPLNNPVDGATTGFEFQRDAWKNGLYWSKFNEPEAVPVPNCTRVGNGDYAIMALKATRDALYILKEDGIWRLTGSRAMPGGKGWRIDLVSSDIVCVSGRSAAKIGDTVYFLSNRGVARIVGGRIEIVSDPIRDAVTQAISYVNLSKYAAAGRPPLWSWGAGDERNNEYLMGWRAATTNGSSTYFYVFNATTNAWTRWTQQAYGVWQGLRGGSASLLTSTDATRRIFGGTSACFACMVLEPAEAGNTETLNGTAWRPVYDDASTKVVSNCVASGTTATLTITSGFDFTPTDGFVIFANDSTKTPFPVVSGSGTTYTIYIGTSTAYQTSGNVSAYKAVLPIVEFFFSAGDNAIPKAWSRASLGFDDINGLSYPRMSFESSESTTAVHTYQRWLERRQKRNGSSMTTQVPSAHASSEVLFVSFRPYMSHGDFELSSCAAEFSDAAAMGRPL